MLKKIRNKIGGYLQKGSAYLACSLLMYAPSGHSAEFFDESKEILLWLKDELSTISITVAIVMGIICGIMMMFGKKPYIWMGCIGAGGLLIWTIDGVVAKFTGG